jgi:hypothetical protein
MNSMKQCIVFGGLALFLLIAACATPPEPFEYQQNNELKPGPGILTGEEGVFTIYGAPPKPAGESSGEDEPEQFDQPADP